MKIYCSPDDYRDLIKFKGKDLWVNAYVSKRFGSRSRSYEFKLWIKILDVYHDEASDITYCEYLAYTPDNIVTAPPLPAYRIQIIKPFEVMTYNELKENFDSIV